MIVENFDIRTLLVKTSQCNRGDFYWKCMLKPLEMERWWWWFLYFFLTKINFLEKRIKNKRNYFDNFLWKFSISFAAACESDLMIAAEGKWNKWQIFYEPVEFLRLEMIFFSAEADDGTTPTLRQLFMTMRQIQFDLQDIKSQLNQERTLRGDLQRLVMTHIEKCASGQWRGNAFN